MGGSSAGEADEPRVLVGAADERERVGGLGRRAARVVRGLVGGAQHDLSGLRPLLAFGGAPREGGVRGLGLGERPARGSELRLYSEPGGDRVLGLAFGGAG